MSSKAFNCLCIEKITCLITCKKPARCASITHLYFLYVEAWAPWTYFSPSMLTFSFCFSPGQTHFWPPPPKIYWSNIQLSWIYTSMWSIYLFQCPIIRENTSIFYDTHPKDFQSIFNFHGFVSSCKKSGYFVTLFWSYNYFQNPVIWLAKNILTHLRKKIFLKYGICAGI